MNLKRMFAFVLSILLVVLSFGGCADTSSENGGNDEMKTIPDFIKAADELLYDTKKARIYINKY